MGLETRESGAIYLGIAKGNITAKGKKGDEGVQTREYKDDDGNVQTIYEYQYSKLNGIITKIVFRDGKFGEECRIHVTDVGEDYILTIKTDDRYFQDFAKKIPNVDLSQEVSLAPFDFEGDNGKPVRGMTIEQGGEKVLSYYYDADKKKDINGFPTVTKADRKEYDSDDWKMYFIKVKKFLKKQVQGLDFSTTVSKPTSKSEAPVVEDDDQDLPF